MLFLAVSGAVIGGFDAWKNGLDPWTGELKFESLQLSEFDPRCAI